MSSMVKRAVQGFSLGWRARKQVGGMIAQRRGFAAGWAARLAAEQKRLVRRQRLHGMGESAKKAGLWTMALAAIGAVILTSTMGDEIGEFLTGQKRAGATGPGGQS